MSNVAPTSAAPAPVVHVATAQSRKPRLQVAAARASMTPTTNALISDQALAFRLGKGSFAGALNDTIRFRVEGTGPMSSRTLVPDSETALALMQGVEGARLVRQIAAAKDSIQGFEDRQNLKSIILPKDVDGVLATSLVNLAELDVPYGHQVMKALSDPEASADPSVREFIQRERAVINTQYRQGVAAWNQGGTIIFRPDIARAMLTAAGAFRPGPDAGPSVKSATAGAKMVNHIPVHEVQHSATPVSRTFYSTPAKWLEEAVAQTLSYTPQILERTARQSGVNRHSYAGHLAHEPRVDLGWKDWKAQKRSAAEEAENKASVGRNYARSQEVLRDLLELGGYSFGSAKEITRTKRLLQGEPVEQLTDRLAKVLVRTWKVDPARTEELSRRIGTVIDDEGGLPKLQLDFGLGV